MFFTNLLIMGCKHERGRKLHGSGVERGSAATPFPDLSTTTISLSILLKESEVLFLFFFSSSFFSTAS